MEKTETFVTTGDLIPSLPYDVARDCLQRVPLDGLRKLRLVSTAWRATASDPAFLAERRKKGYTHNYACFLQAAIEPEPKPAPAGARKVPTYVITVYDPKNATWSTLPPIPDFAHLGLPIFCRCVAAGPHLLVIGGWDPVTWSVLTSVYIYSFATGAWRRGADMPAPRSFFAAAASASASSSDQSRAGATVLVAGGHDHEKNALRSAHLYNLDSDTWEALPDMRHQRDECAAVALSGGRFIVVSGFSTESQGQFLPSAEIYDRAMGTWEMSGEEEHGVWPAGKPPNSIVSIRGELHAILDGSLMVYRPDPAGLGSGSGSGGSNGSDRKWWRVVAGMPSELSVVSSATVLGEDGILVCGYRGGSQESYQAYQVSSSSLSASTAKRWKKVMNGGEHGFCGLAQSACTVEV